MTLGQYDEQLTRAVQKIGSLKPVDLERIAGALFLSQNRNGDVNERTGGCTSGRLTCPSTKLRRPSPSSTSLVQETGTVLKG